MSDKLLEKIKEIELTKQDFVVKGNKVHLGKSDTLSDLKRSKLTFCCHSVNSRFLAQ